jgi:hypothetical protein
MRERRGLRYVPEVTIVHPRAEGELPPSSCESIACAPGSATGPPSMTACSKRTMAALDRIFFLRYKTTNRKNEQAGRTASCSGDFKSHRSASESASRRPCPSCAAVAPSKPYSFPKISHATRTPGVESMSVLEGGFENIRTDLWSATSLS